MRKHTDEQFERAAGSLANMVIEIHNECKEKLHETDLMMCHKLERAAEQARMITADIGDYGDEEKSQ